MQDLSTPGSRSEVYLAETQQGWIWVTAQTQNFKAKNHNHIASSKTVPVIKGTPIEKLKHLRVAKIHTRNPDSEVLSTAFGLTLNDGQHA